MNINNFFKESCVLLSALAILLIFLIFFIPYFTYHRARYGCWPWDYEEYEDYDEDWVDEVKPSCRYCTRAKWNGFDGVCPIKGSVRLDDYCENFKPKLLFEIDKWLEEKGRCESHD